MGHLVGGVILAAMLDWRRRKPRWGTVERIRAKHKVPWVRVTVVEAERKGRILYVV